MGMDLTFIAKKDYDKYYLNDGEYYNENMILAYGRKSWGLFRYFKNISEPYTDEYTRIITKEAFETFVDEYSLAYLPMKIALKFAYWYEFRAVEPDPDSWISELYIKVLNYFDRLVDNPRESDRDVFAIIKMLENRKAIRKVLKNDVIVMECSY